MSIVSLESADEKKVSASILNFLTAYGVISLLSKCGGTKLKGVPVKALFTYTLTNVFRPSLTRKNAVRPLLSRGCTAFSHNNMYYTRTDTLDFI